MKKVQNILYYYTTFDLNQNCIDRHNGSQQQYLATQHSHKVMIDFDFSAVAHPVYEQMSVEVKSHTQHHSAEGSARSKDIDTLKPH